MVRALVAFGHEDGDFVLDHDEVDFLARTFYREKLGSQEAAYVCLGPAWKHDTHKGGHCRAEKLEKQQQQETFIIVSEVVDTGME